MCMVIRVLLTPMKCDIVTGHCNVSVAGQESCVKKVHDKDINKYSNSEIHLDVKRKIGMHLFLKSFDSNLLLPKKYSFKWQTL